MGVPIIDPSFNSIDYSKQMLLNYSFHVANVLKWTYKDKTNSVGVGGCGMDMGFHLVYTLASVLYNDGYALTHRYI